MMQLIYIEDITRVVISYETYISLVMRKPAFSICENKEADQLHGNRKADQRLCFSPHG